MSDFQQFLYVTLKENYAGKSKQKTDTTLRIVFWEANEELEYDEHFVIYGKRPKSKISGEFVPYRLTCSTICDVLQFVKTVVSPDHNLAVELHQFQGYTDDSEDWYNIDWENTADDSSTELVAFDVESKTAFGGEQFVDFKSALTNVLQVLVSHAVV
jgi:hypothetical protein